MAEVLIVWPLIFIEFEDISHVLNPIWSPFEELLQGKTRSNADDLFLVHATPGNLHPEKQ